jgi:hypothetical protein
MAERFFSEEGRRSRLGGQFDRLTSNLERDAQTATSAGLQGALDFDPTQAVTRFGQGFLDEAREGLGQDFESLAGQSVGSGRLRTGFFQRDSGRLFQDFNRRVSNAIAQQSLEASRQSLVNIQGLQGFGGDLLRQQTDVLGGAFDRATAEDNAQGGGFFGKALGFAAGIAGTALAGPIGGAIAGRIAGGITNRGGGGGGGGGGSTRFGELDFGRPTFQAG